MKKQLMKVGIILFVTSSIFASCSKDGDPGPEGPEGPQGIAGEKGDPGEKGDQGETGTANATLYKFDGHDFEASIQTEREIALENEQEMTESAWLVYVVLGGTTYHLPGYGYADKSEYRTYNLWSTDVAKVYVRKTSGLGEAYDAIHIIRIAVGSVVDNTTGKVGNTLPEDLDVSNYEAVKDYYNITD